MTRSSGVRDFGIDRLRAFGRNAEHVGHAFQINHRARAHVAHDLAGMNFHHCPTDVEPSGYLFVLQVWVLSEVRWRLFDYGWNTFGCHECSKDLGRRLELQAFAGRCVHAVGEGGQIFWGSPSEVSVQG